MDDHRILQENEQTASLHTYLHDHAAGARHAIELLKALKNRHADSSLGVFAADLLQQVSADLEILENLAVQMGAGGFQAKELAGWFTDKLSRVKLSPLEKPFHTFEALEFLSLGILGKRALWKVLSSVASNPKLHGIDFEALIRRAKEQYAATETMRLQMAAQVFG